MIHLLFSILVFYVWFALKKIKFWDLSSTSQSAILLVSRACHFQLKRTKLMRSQQETSHKMFVWKIWEESFWGWTFESTLQLPFTSTEKKKNWLFPFPPIRTAKWKFDFLRTQRNGINYIKYKAFPIFQSYSTATFNSDIYSMTSHVRAKLTHLIIFSLLAKRGDSLLLSCRVFPALSEELIVTAHFPLFPSRNTHIDIRSRSGLGGVGETKLQAEHGGRSTEAAPSFLFSFTRLPPLGDFHPILLQSQVQCMRFYYRSTCKARDKIIVQHDVMNVNFQAQSQLSKWIEKFIRRVGGWKSGGKIELENEKNRLLVL